MKNFSSPLLAAVALSLTAQVALAAEVSRNDRLYDVTGASVAKVHRVADDGDVVLIYNGKVVRVQAETLSNKDGKLMTSMTKREIRRLK